jgi:hypothetical protein
MKALAYACVGVVGLCGVGSLASWFLFGNPAELVWGCICFATIAAICYFEWVIGRNR